MIKKIGILIILLVIAVIAWSRVSTTKTPLKDQPASTVTGKNEQTVRLYFVAIGDAGRSGTEIGCGDSLVPVEVNIPKTSDVLKTSLTRLLSIKEQYVGEAELYQSLYQSDITVDRIEVDGEKAMIYLTGSVRLGGVCDAPRVEEQLKATALQTPTIKTVEFYLNTVPLQEALSSR